ncbi:hypothetical protein [Diplocloster hominis]|uniref:hypothetical protein n=1 Tax=Diplocloster hominis TaxID=3079010 RepID=UPI0031BA7843
MIIGYKYPVHIRTGFKKLFHCEIAALMGIVPIGYHFFFVNRQAAHIRSNNPYGLTSL